ncbi:XkdX family protein [Bacillus smithii]|uniref:XkdX family protein n=1 Tax=Bacillus smithii TaxID=1479 RepID=UPI002E1A2E60|nr:XkdX family protein [Bacillus smithii]MED1456665.1 XkdX family protein [Bacillus smithii]
MLDWYASIKLYYEHDLWTKGRVWDAVSKGKITPEQYTEITGDQYPTERPTG